MCHSDLTWTEEMMLINQKNYLQDDILAKLDRAAQARLRYVYGALAT